MNDDYQYTYDADGNVISETNTQHTAFNENFTYDGLSQLTAVSRGTDSGYQSFTMNNIGDIQSVSSDGTTTNRTTNADNQIIHIGSATVSYDNNGNVTTDDKGNTLVYDAWNRLVEVKNSSGDLVAGYTYDGLGRMTSETDGITTIDFYYSGEQIIEERTGVTNATGGSTGSNGSVTEELVYSPDYVNDVLSRDTYVSGSYSSRVFFTHDANYDVTGVVQNSTGGTMLQRMTYDAYGNVTFLTSSWATTTDSYAVENLWQGGWHDVNTGYYHFQERWYSPSMQWLSWDPANYPDGPSAYVPEDDDPVDRLDSSGDDSYGDDLLYLRQLLEPGTTADLSGDDANGTASRELNSEVLSNVMPGLPPDTTDVPLINFDFKRAILSHLSDPEVSLPIDFEFFSKNFDIGAVPCLAEVTGSIEGSFGKKEGRACFTGAIGIELAIYVGGKFADSSMPKLLEAEGNGLVKAEAKIPQASVALGGGGGDSSGWTINGKMFLTGGLRSYSAGLEAKVPLGTLGWGTGLKLHIPKLSDVTVTFTSGEGTGGGAGFTAEDVAEIKEDVG